jgi:hypothetical protein
VICARKSDRCSEKWYCAQGLVIGARKSDIVFKGLVVLCSRVGDRCSRVGDRCSEK